MNRFVSTHPYKHTRPYTHGYTFIKRPEEKIYHQGGRISRSELIRKELNTKDTSRSFANFTTPTPQTTERSVQPFKPLTNDCLEMSGHPWSRTSRLMVEEEGRKIEVYGFQ